jgi:hypothetical protein
VRQHYDHNPQVCPDGHRIVRWTIGVATWNGFENKPVAITGICSNGKMLQSMAGSTAQEGTIEKDASLSSPTNGFTCNMLQQRSETDHPDPSYTSVATFLGFETRTRTDVTIARDKWNICAAMPATYVAVGYEQRTGALIDAVRFIMADGKYRSVVFGVVITNTCTCMQTSATPHSSPIHSPPMPTCTDYMAYIHRLQPCLALCVWTCICLHFA